MADPLSAAGLALGVASLGLQVYTGCIQGIQLLVTAINFPEECRYLNLRLRMEQQRLFAWSEASGLLDFDEKNATRILENNAFSLHRQTVLDLLVQIQCLFKEFQEHQKKNSRLQTTPDNEQVLQKPEKDAAEANFPLPEKRRAFIKKAMTTLQGASKEAVARLKWVSFDKAAFEILLTRFAALNDNMTNILDAKMQVEIHHTVQDTNRGMLQLHRKITDLSRLVMALNIRLEADSVTSTPLTPMSVAQKRANADGLQLLSQLAKFKAFNESIESDKKAAPDDATRKSLELGRPSDQRDLELKRTMIELDPNDDDADRCEAVLKITGQPPKKVWVEWKDYESQGPQDPSPPKEVILERVRKLAALLNHTPKPEAFRTPHCLGFFDKARPDPSNSDEEEDIRNMRLGLIFERPLDDTLHTSLPPISLNELLQTARRPRVTERVKLAHAISNCLLYLHAVNWLHKGLRSHNVVFFRTASGHVDYAKPYLSGFDFSRPARPDEMTEVPADEFDLYRHPNVQSALGGRRERFKKSFDIYSLGVLLVEIARWTTVDRVLGIDTNAGRRRNSVAFNVRKRLLDDEQIEELGACMGSMYESAAKKCLEGEKALGLAEGDDETDDRVAAKLGMVLHEEVVKPLGDSLVDPVEMLFSVVVCVLLGVTHATPLRALKSDVEIVVDNDLQASNSTTGVVLLGKKSFTEAEKACKALGEELWEPTASNKALEYLTWKGRVAKGERLWVRKSGNVTRAVDDQGTVGEAKERERLGALCTQTAPFSTGRVQDTGGKWRVEVQAGGQTLTGYRDRLSFRFFGVRYAPQPKRFTYSTVFEGKGESVSALEFGAQCAQGSAGSGSEDCLFLNIWTPYLPGLGCEKEKKNNLKPVGVWIHGGAFTGGTANDATFDGGNIVSRGDMVLVAINYRLSTLGFLALKDGVTNGNYGLADQITALDWIRANIASFGGDPSRITIFGQSAGAGSVRALMASPKAAGKFASAIPLSNLGGINYGTTYSKYYSIDEQLTAAGNAILAATNCTGAPSQVDCLRALPVSNLLSAGTARYLVVDGTYLTTSELPLTSGPPLNINLMMGITADDGGPFIRYPTTTNQSTYLSSQGFDLPPASLFPIPALANETLALYNASTRLATDGIFRCVDQATVYAGLESNRFDKVWYYEFDRTYQTTGWPQTDVCEPPRTAERPHGDTRLPYFRCHSGELYYVFGNLARQGLPLRDAGDLVFEQYVLDSFAAFVRTGNPNPDRGFLKARGFEGTLGRVEEDGEWIASRKGELKIRVLDLPGRMEGFREREQCKGLGLGVEEYYRV
ncbi:hypothetical protein OQA88_196 [Cercophora sp. LCS_1]